MAYPNGPSAGLRNWPTTPTSASRRHGGRPLATWNGRPRRARSAYPWRRTPITRRYKGRSITVTVLADGFEYLGERFRSLTAVAKAVTGSHMNGFRFFGVEGKP